MASPYERMVESEEELAARLEQEFTPLDPALVRAILSDYDFRKPEQVLTLREYLDTLRASAVAEDDALFDPSGTSGQAEAAASRSVSGLNIAFGGALSVSEDTDTTSVSNGLSSLSLDSAPESANSGGNDSFMDGLEKLSTKDKTARLLEMFPSERPSDVLFALQKCGNNFNRAMDSLLNQVFLEDADTPVGERVPTRGVDAFAVEHVLPRGGKSRKGKGRKVNSLEEPSSSSCSTIPPALNKWETASTEIHFIASRAKLTDSQVSSIYHNNGASKPNTILALIEQNIATLKAGADGPNIDIDATSLSEEFPSLTIPRAAALIRLTHPSTAAAHELARALMSTIKSADELSRIVPQYVPIRLDEPSSPRPVSPAPPSAHGGSSASLAAARNTAFNKASNYYRKGKSDHLMGGAAAYYATLGRDANTQLKVAAAAEADALVTSQSTATQLDLHGVSVKDAVRIASEKVRLWWHDVQEGRLRGGPLGAAHFRIITGLGRHSSGGVAKVGPAVAKMLIREGWRVEVGGGVLVVDGVVKSGGKKR